MKFSEAEGWLEQDTPDFLIRAGCIISLRSSILYPPSSILVPSARLTYTGGYVLPGDPDPQPPPPSPQPVRLPADLESAAVEQVACWYQTRDTLGLKTIWPRDAAYKQLAQLPLLLPVQTTLSHYQRCAL